MNVSVVVDASKMLAHIKNIANRVPDAIEAADEAVADEILRLATQQVPHDKGDLQNSGTVEKVGRLVMVGFNMVYAARLHEHPEYRFQKGRKGKYLEDPIRDNADRLGIKYGTVMKGKLL